MLARDLTRQLGDHLSPRTTSRLRAALGAWGWLTAPVRMEPDLLVVGAQRAGTTTMFRLLSEHPDLVRPTATKGTSYFDDEYHRGPRWYRSHFPVRALAALARPGRDLRAFECSGYYLFHPLAAERIARDLPRAHVVVLVRDPVERARSAHRHEVARGFESLPFDAAVAAEKQRLAGEEQRLVDEPGYRSQEHRHHAYVGRGRYAEQVQRLVDALGRDRVHVVDADRFFADPVPQFVALQRRLGLSVWVPAAVERWNARPADPLPPDEHAELLQRFADSDAALADLLGEEPSWRTAAVTR
ncbi:sulfotransferase [Nocardioides sp. Arc9.136]|uniref:sulfotransferase n=1 Tax=Nocardioides sp. Arc9.136 TaxID=2996826 RepID=UPI002666C0D9|nr:sulfotransferase [Nocardioides sp. Arc9.136]WKN46993.1 sulfotransferase domain-containing protein [Nocardioides sp. Arc9.136]